MKKALSIALVLMMVIFAVVSCGNEPASTAKITQQIVDEAADMIYEFNKPGANNIKAADFTLPAKTEYEGYDITVAWTVEGGNGLVTLETADSVTTVKVNPYADEDTEFTLKGVVSGGEYSKTISLTYKIEEYSIASWDYWAENTKGVTMNIRGIIVAKYYYNESAKNTSLLMQDLDGAHGYMAYNVACASKDAYDKDLAVGNIVVINGTTSIYNGLREMGTGCTYTVEKNSDGSYATGTITKISIDQLIADGANLDTVLDQYQGMIATITGAKIKNISWNSSTAETYYELGKGSVYVTVVKGGVEFKLYLSTSNTLTLDQLKEEYEKLGIGYTINVEGPICWYNGPQLYPCAGGITVTSTSVSDEDKISAEVSKISVIPASVNEATTVELPATGTEYTDVTFTWTVSGDTAAIADGVLTLTPGASTTEVTVTLTAVCGNATETKEYTVTLINGEPSYEDIVNSAYALENRKTLDGTFRLYGEIVSIDTPYDAGYGNITVTIVIGDMTDKPIQCFRLKGDGVDALAVGDKITVEGVLINYDGKIEFNSGCVLVGMGEVLTPAKIVKNAYALAKDEKITGVTLTGVITSVDTAYSEQYGNITVTIVVDGLDEFPIQCFRAKGAEGVDISGLAVGDTITITGDITNYVSSSGKSTIEFTAGALVSEIVKDTTSEMGKIVKAAYKLAKDEKITGTTLTGVITSVDTAYSEQYGNITVTIVVDGLDEFPIQCFRAKGAEGVDISGLAVGDTITITGDITNYVSNSSKSTIEFTAGALVSEISK